MAVDYSSTQKALLVEEVAALCKILGRPICSNDLLARWRENPERRPLLTQGVGQLLLKATRPCKQVRPILFQVGLLGKFGFYAPNQHPEWKHAFRQHAVEHWSAIHLKWEIPNQAVSLLGTEHESVGRNALAGFLEEYERVADDSSVLLPEQIHELLATARRQSPGKFNGRCPNLISRKDAQVILTQEMEIRDPFFSGSPSTHRYLAELHWPLTPLFSKSGFWDEQIRLFCAARWPLDEDPLVAKARWLCGAYGLPQQKILDNKAAPSPFDADGVF